MTNPNEVFQYDLDPATMRILGKRLMVRRYERPEMVGSIVLPEMARTDQSSTLWEFVKAGATVDLDMEFNVGDILRTRAETGIPIGDGFWLIPSDMVEGIVVW